MTWGILATTATIFLYLKLGNPSQFYPAIFEFGLVPTNIHDEKWISRFFSYLFVHSSWFHVLTNMWILWIFGDNIEDVMGAGRFLLFYLLCGIVAGIAHILTIGGSVAPVVGASGAVSGVLGAFLLMYPRGKITTFVFFVTLRLPAAIYLGAWFFLQFYAAISAGKQNIAWWAHIGGFLAGLALLPLLRNRPPGVDSGPNQGVLLRPYDPCNPWMVAKANEYLSRDA